MRVHRSAPLALLLAVVVGCSSAGEDGADVEQLRAELASRSEAEQELAERIERLEQELTRVVDDTSIRDRLAQLEDEVGRLDGALDAVDDGLEAEAAARGSAVEELEIAINDLRRRIEEVADDAGGLRAELDELRAQQEALRDRLDRQQRGE